MKIRVLIVDDSALMREALTKILSIDREIEVVGTAPDPYIAVEKIKKLKPDVLTLDIEMPRMDGLTFLEKLIKVHPIPVVMISTWTSQNSEKAIKALSLGAVDFVEKPSSNIQEKINDLSNEIISKVKNASKCIVRKTASGMNLRQATFNIQNDNFGRVALNKVILIGASTGGTTAIETIISRLPSNMTGIVIVQHMPEYFTKVFAERLNNLYPLDIKEMKDGDIVRQGTILIAPGGKQCYLKPALGGFSVQVTDDPPVNRLKPSIDALFLSAAQYNCKRVLGVMLTGMGKDGAKGMLALKRSGSYNIAQDETSCVIFGMPKEAIDLGAVDEIVSLKKIADRLMELVT